MEESEDRTRVRGLQRDSRIISVSFVFGCVVNSRKFEPRPGIETNVDCTGASLKIVFGVGEGDEDDEKMRDGDLESDFDKRRSEPD